MLSEPDVHEVVIVDNSSGDGSADLLRQAFDDTRVRLVESSTNLGFGRGVNLGVEHSTAPLSLILNSDTTLTPGSLGVLIETLLSDDSVGVVAPAVYGPDGRTPQWGAFGALPNRVQIILGRWPPASGRAPLGWVSGVAMLLRRPQFVSIGGFDADFDMYFEDIDLCRRLGEFGKDVRRQTAASVVHGIGMSWGSKSEQVRKFHQSKLVYLEKVGATRLELRSARLIAWARASTGRR